MSITLTLKLTCQDIGYETCLASTCPPPPLPWPLGYFLSFLLICFLMGSNPRQETYDQLHIISMATGQNYYSNKDQSVSEKTLATNYAFMLWIFFITSSNKTTTIYSIVPYHFQHRKNTCLWMIDKVHNTTTTVALVANLTACHWWMDAPHPQEPLWEWSTVGSVKGFSNTHQSQQHAVCKWHHKSTENVAP